MTQNSNLKKNEIFQLLKHRCGRRRSYIQDKYFPQEFIAEYDPKSLFLGWDVDTNEEFFINCQESKHSLILGMTGSGKTFYGEEMISRSWKSGYSTIYLDIKGDSRFWSKPIQKEFADNLGKHEKPEGLPILCLIPSFFKEYYDKYEKGVIPKGCVQFQFSLGDLTEADLILVLKANDDSRKNIVRAIYQEMKEFRITNFDEMKEYLEKNTSIHTNSKNHFYNEIDYLKSNRVFGEQCNIDLIDEMNKGNPISLIYKYIDNYDPENGMPYIYLSILLRKLLTARTNKDLVNPLVMFFDEAHKYVPNSDNPPSKKSIIYTMNVARSSGISLMLLTQDPKHIPDDIIKQMTSISIPYNIDPDIRSEILRKTGTNFLCGYDDFSTAHIEWTRLFSQIKKVGMWCYLDKSKKRYKFLRIASPLCYHKKEDSR